MKKDETADVKFNKAGFAVHRPCGERLTEIWTVSRVEEYSIRRDGTVELAYKWNSEKNCSGIFCDRCDIEVTLG